MARKDEDNYKAGVDFEWVTAKGSNYKTRRFFSKAEKEAMKAPKAEAPKASTKSAPKPKTKAEAPASKDPMKGYRTGDVTTTKLGKSAGGGRGDGGAEMIRRRADAALSRVAASKDKPASTSTATVKPTTTSAERMAKARTDAEARRSGSQGAGRATSTKKEGKPKVVAVPSKGLGIKGFLEGLSSKNVAVPVKKKDKK